ncbi:MAG: hypothetical protein RR263_00065, partial [Oscillospiraceae bacterium]
DLNEALRVELKELAGTFNLYRRNQLEVFELIEETVDEILPRKVMEQYGMFAEVKTFGQGDRPVFNKKEGRKRAKQFITRVGLAGIYEVFKLDKSTFEVPTGAFGGAAQIGFEEFLDGKVDFAEVTEIIMEGLDEAVYVEIAKALVGGLKQLPTANKDSHAGFDAAKMDKLVAVARAYGDPTIYCTYEFAATMLPDQAWASDAMKNEVGSNGYLANYKGARVIVLPQSYEDETNSVKVIDPSYAWIIPSGGNDKPVKVAFEGQTIVREYENKDLSREIQVYKKLGVVAMMTNNICSYRNTSLTK